LWDAAKAVPMGKFISVLHTVEKKKRSKATIQASTLGN
jgi:hypothetical protein